MADPVIEISIEGEGDITGDVIIAGAEFSSYVNGTPGACSFRVRDLDGSRSFASGKRILLKIDGENKWAGYVSFVARVYVFPAEDVAGKVERFFRIDGEDINILFRRRAVFNQSDPANNSGYNFRFPGPNSGAAFRTSDQEALDELFANWLDLSGDDLVALSTGSGGGIEFVGYINEDQDSVPWAGGNSWEQAMNMIAKLPAAIYYISPDRVVTYTDVDAANAPGTLTDDESGIGYREMEIIKDGSNLATDVMIWGLGTGSQLPVFKRVSADPEGHGVWQIGELHYDVYKQATVDRIASSILNGSATNKRGHKLDKVVFKCVTFAGGFRAGQKANVVSTAFGFSDVIPIRQMQITFPAGKPRYELTLSHEIDAPWSFYDVFQIKLPEVQVYEIPVGGTNSGGVVDTPVSASAAVITTTNGEIYISDIGPIAPGSGASGGWDSGPTFFDSDWGSTTGGPPGDIFTLFASTVFTDDDGNNFWEFIAVRTRRVSTLLTPPDVATYPTLRFRGTVSNLALGFPFFGSTGSTTAPAATPWNLYFVYEGGVPLSNTSGDDLDLSGRGSALLASGAGVYGSPEAFDVTIPNPDEPGYIVLRVDAPTEVPGLWEGNDQLFPYTTGYELPAGVTGDAPAPYAGQTTLLGSGFRITAPPKISDQTGGDRQSALTGLTSTTMQLDQPYWWGTPRVFKNGKILRAVVDYALTDPIAGVITLTDMPDITDAFLVIYRVRSELGGAGIPFRLRSSYS